MPAGWRWTRLDDLCSDVCTIDARKLADSSFTYIDISAVNPRSKTITKPKNIQTFEAPLRARQVVRHGDILVSTTRPNLNAVAIVPIELDGAICSTGFCVLRPKSQANSPYLFAFVRCSSFVTALSDLTKGALYPAVTDKQVKSQHIPLPPIAKQRRIADRLKTTMAEQARLRAAVETTLASIDRVETSAVMARLSRLLKKATRRR